jgi:group I intron endonuclease
VATESLCRPGIYVIRNTISGRRYVGSASRIDSRWRMHLKELRQGTHHSRVFQRSWDKHGEAAFSFDVLEFVEDKTSLVAREQFWIDALGAHHTLRGLNIAPKAGSNRGIIRSEEARENYRIGATGRVFDAATIERRSAARRGKKHKASTIALMHANRSGKPQPSKRALTFDIAEEIRRIRRDDNLSQDLLAARFGCSRKSVREILAGNTYTAP